MSRSIHPMKDSAAIHEFYMTIINNIPSIVYWIDTECNLLGCNRSFIQTLTAPELKNLQKTPYESMIQSGHWPEQRVEQLKLDDIGVMFSKEAQYNTLEPPIKCLNDKKLSFLSTRIPILDEAKEITGLIVILTETTTKTSQKSTVQSNSKKSINENYSPNVLIVEDSFLAQCLERSLLTQLHCQVDIADSLDTTLALFHPGKYDLVFMDIGLKNTSGYVVAKKLRQLEEQTSFHVPIIALTGYKADVVKEDCKQYLMEGVITKPLNSIQAEQLIAHFVYHLDVPVSGLQQS